MPGGRDENDMVKCAVCGMWFEDDDLEGEGSESAGVERAAGEALGSGEAQDTAPGRVS